MKVYNNFFMAFEDKLELYRKLCQLEESIKLARGLISYEINRGRDPEPLKFLNHDYDLILGDFGIDFLHRPHGQDAESIGHQADPAPSPGFPDVAGWPSPGPSGS